MPTLRSPFPGMDPYLESEGRWGDFHSGLLIEIKKSLQPRLPADLRARAEENIFFESSDEEIHAQRYYRSDVSVRETSRIESHEAGGRSNLAVMPEPIRIRVVEEEVRESWIEIVDISKNNRLVTVIEVLSPSNKSAGKANARYRLKLKGYQDAAVNIVEIDLLRSSRERLFIKGDGLPGDLRKDFLACVNLATDSELWLAYPMSFRDPLPTIPIPCRPNDPEVPLSLQPLIENVYRDGRHDDIDYLAPLQLPLSSDDATWLNELLQKPRITAD